MRKLFECHGSKYDYNDVLLDADMDKKVTRWLESLRKTLRPDKEINRAPI